MPPEVQVTESKEGPGFRGPHHNGSRCRPEPSPRRPSPKTVQTGPRPSLRLPRPLNLADMSAAQLLNCRIAARRYVRCAGGRGFDRSRTLSGHSRQHALHGLDRGRQVDLNVVQPVVDGDIGQVPDRSDHASVVDQNVDSPTGFRRSERDRSHRTRPPQCRPPSPVRRQLPQDAPRCAP